MVEKTSSSGTLNSLLGAAAFVVVVAGMKAASSLVVSFLLAAFIAIVCAPALHWLQKKKVPSPLALIIVILSLGIVSLGIIAFMGSQVASFTGEFAKYKEQLEAITETILAKWQSVETWLIEKGLMPKPPEETERKSPFEMLFESLNLADSLQFANNLLAGIGVVLGNAFLILLTVIFILLEAAGFPNKLKALSGGADAQRQFDRIVADIRRYVVLKTWMCLLTGVASTLLLLFMGVDYPFLWGMLAFLLNYVPNIGSFIAAIPAVLLALIQFHWIGAIGAIVGYTVINLVIGNILEPRIMGRGLGLSTLVVFVSLILWGWVFGPVGMLLSAPLTMIVKIVLENRSDTRWIAILLSSEVAVETDETPPQAQSASE